MLLEYMRYFVFKVQSFTTDGSVHYYYYYFDVIYPVKVVGTSPLKTLKRFIKIFYFRSAYCLLGPDAFPRIWTALPPPWSMLMISLTHQILRRVYAARPRTTMILMRMANPDVRARIRTRMALGRRLLPTVISISHSAQK